MEQLRRELSHLLGEKLSRMECVSENPSSTLWSLYDVQGNPLPLLAKSFTTPGVAHQLAWKISMLTQSGSVRMPIVYGVLTHEDHPAPDVVLIERLRGVSAEVPARTPQRREQLQEQIVEALLAWHRHGSGGCVGMIDSAQENVWPKWYGQHVEMLWSTLNLCQPSGLTMQDKQLLFRSRECLPDLFHGFNDNCVLVHGNFTLRSMLKETRSDQLLAIVGAGMMLWAPREYELFRLSDGGQEEQLLWHYLRRAPVAESFLWRRWLYLLWDEVDKLVNRRQFDRARFQLAAKSLLPWLS
ncbi:YcbJ family phosphotransferase [Enterobacteriaceae bacterium ESL0689]|nr:YcbJ family phosphotransferase [Enterobacteriaceae bacterium ESL0689]